MNPIPTFDLRRASGTSNTRRIVLASSDAQSGNESNIEGTPAIFVNRYAFEDAISLEALSETVDDALAAAS